MKILPVGAELFHADRLTDMTKLIIAFRNFVLRCVIPVVYVERKVTIIHRMYQS